MAEYHNQVIAGLDAVLLLVDGDGTVLYANDRSRHLLGRDLTGVPMDPSSFEDDPPLLTTLAAFVRDAGTEGAEELTIDRHGGQPRYLWTRLGRDVEGRRLLQVNDISEAICGTDAMGKIFSQVNHDLRSPLTSISGGAELLLSGRVGALDGVQRRLVTIIEDSSRKMQQILQETRDRLALKEAAVGGGGE